MDINDLFSKETIHPILDYLVDLEWYYLLLLFFIIGMIKDRKIEWLYNIKLFVPEGKDVAGKIELIKSEEHHPEMTLEMKSLKKMYGKETEIYIEDNLIAKFYISGNGNGFDMIHPAQSNLSATSSRKRNYKRWNKIKLDLEEHIVPENKQKITIKIGEDIALHGIILW